MLETLSKVQALDLELDALEAERERTPPALIEARSRERHLSTELSRRQGEHDALRSRVSAAELELKSLQERRKDAAEGALRAATGKEASQYQNQELQFATRAQELEEDTLPLMEELEARGHDVQGLRDQVGALEPELERLSDDERQRLEALDAQAAALQSQREALVAAIEPALVRQYEQVRRARRGLALVPVVGGQRCGGCNVRLPIFVVQKVRKGDGVTRCPSCGRILYQDQADGEA